MSMPPPLIRTRNAAATRAAILEAARRRFVQESYDAVGLRELAAEAGVDAAMVSRYFGSKEELFAEVLAAAGDGGEIFQGEIADFGRRIADLMVCAPPDEGKLDGLLIMLRSSSSPKAVEIVRCRFTGFYERFADWLGGEDAAVRARAAGAIMLGASMIRTLTGDFALTPAERRRFVERLARLLQSAIG